jgi:hypothetical protein
MVAENAEHFQAPIPRIVKDQGPLPISFTFPVFLVAINNFKNQTGLDFLRQ